MERLLIKGINRYCILVKLVELNKMGRKKPLSYIGNFLDIDDRVVMCFYNIHDKEYYCYLVD